MASDDHGPFLLILILMYALSRVYLKYGHSQPKKTTSTSEDTKRETVIIVPQHLHPHQVLYIINDVGRDISDL